MIKISKRLQNIASLVPKDLLVADIGSDHALLPIYLVQKGIVNHAIACDIVDGPVNAAKKNVSIYQLEDKINTIKGPGIKPIENIDVKTVVIAGMGGKLISEIIDNSKAYVKNQLEYLLLQPNVGSNYVREILMHLNYRIIDEQVVLDNQKYYEIILAKNERTYKSYSSLELEFGPILMCSKQPLVVEYFKKQMDTLDWIESQVKDAEDLDKIREKKEKLKSIIA